MANPQQIRNSLSQLSEEAKNTNDPSSRNFGRDIDAVNRSIDKISRIPESARTPGQKAALKALEIWRDEPTAYAYTADVPARSGMGRLDPNDSNGSDLKCNRFVAEVFTQSGTGYPIRGRNPLNRTPLSAETMYNEASITGMSNIDPKNAQIGDIICFSGHVGIYLGNGVYVSAHVTSSRYGNQVADGVEIHRVPWNQQPKFRRMDSRQASVNSEPTQIASAGEQTTQQYSDPTNQNGGTPASRDGGQTTQQLVTSDNLGNSETKEQLEAINKLIASNFSAEPGDPIYKKVLPDVLRQLNKANPDLNTDAIAKLANVSLQQELSKC
jgi:NlpC/P60 family